MKKNIIQTLLVITSAFGFASCSGGGSSGNTFIPTGTLATQATFSEPAGIAIKGSTVYIAEGVNSYHGVHKVVSNYIYDFAGGTGAAGAVEGAGSAATFNNPGGLAVDAAGNVYVADRDNNKIRKITTAGLVTTFAGSGAVGSANGTGAAAQFNGPMGLTFDTLGNLYVADSFNNKIRKITPGGVVTDYAGFGGAGGSVNSTALNSTFNNPIGIAFDSSGNLFVSDNANHMIRKIAPNAGNVTLFAGALSAGTANGTGAAARFEYPGGLVVDTNNNIYVADVNNHTIRKITPAAVVTTYIGLATTPGSTNGTGPAVRLNTPTYLAIDSMNTIYVSELGNHLVRVVTPGLLTSTFAGH